MFFLKKLISQGIYPTPFLFFLSLIVLVMILKSSAGRAVKAVTTLFFITLCAISFQPIPNGITRSLEMKYPALLETPTGVRTVVVLGGGSCADPLLPTSSQLSSASLIRLTEGISQLNRLDSAAELIVTGGALFDSVTIAFLQRKMAIQLGVDSSRIAMADSANDTEAEAVAVRMMVEEDEIILVTSATHMNRALGLFQKVGFDPIPAPTNYQVKEGPFTPGSLFPSAANIYKLRKSVHELFGTLWSRLRGKI
jgi:uncharacterized SAM-binding protein YcdF (DUF218 family)